MDGPTFRACTEQVLAPQRWTTSPLTRSARSPNDRGQGRRAPLSAAYSPDLNPIENAFAKLKALLRKAAERTIEGLWTTIGKLFDRFSPAECQNQIENAGYVGSA
jgi:hypothetical protein